MIKSQELMSNPVPAGVGSVTGTGAALPGHAGGAAQGGSGPHDSSPKPVFPPPHFLGCTARCPRQLLTLHGAVLQQLLHDLLLLQAQNRVAPGGTGSGTPGPALPTAGDAAELLQHPEVVPVEMPLPAGSTWGFPSRIPKLAFPR